MRKKLRLVFALLMVLQQTASAQTLLHYWSFNNSADQAALLAPTSATVSGAAIRHVAGGISAIQVTSNTGQGFDAENLNARDNNEAGTHLRFNDPIGGALEFSLPTAGFKDVVVKYATRRSGSGAGTQLINYSTDGTTFQRLTTLAPADGNPTLQTLDFTDLVAVNDNPDFKIRISFEQGSGGTVGNNRFDNVTLEANPVGADLLAPTAVFAPATGATLVPPTVQPTITFNEEVRLLNNAAITNENAHELVELRLNNATGTAVGFTAQMAGRVLTVMPAAALLQNQTYYLALKANRIEDLSDNAITTVQAATFTTMPEQTQFQAGDILVVAYRMNATSTEDEIALLTLVNILPGTSVHITDAKYTTNAQAQCAGGFTWTALEEGVAAGTIIRIQNDALQATTGTVSGSGFGLSSGGDQVILYTGTPDAPSYITALSSNAWLENNTVCNGSYSMLPAGLTDGVSALNLSTAAGNVEGNTVNAYYTGTVAGTKEQLQQAILNPANWSGTASGTAAQQWPAWNFPGPPAIVSASTLSQTSIRLVFNNELDQASATTLANYTGLEGLSAATLSDDKKAVTLTYATPFAPAETHTLVVAGVQNATGEAMYSPYSYTFTYTTSIAFASTFMVVQENAGTLRLQLTLENPTEGTVDLVVKGAPFSSAGAADFTLATQTLSFTGSSSAEQIISIPIIDDTEQEQDEYFVLSLENATGLTITGKPMATIYIKDNDRQAPQPTKEIELTHVGSFEPNALDGSTTEIVVHDPLTQRLFMTSAVQDRLDIADFSDPGQISLLKSIDLSGYGGITSVAVHKGIVAVASPNANEQLNGSVVFFNTDGDFLKQVTVGALPDMITFTPDGSKVITANEGQPNPDYTVDPEGSVSVIDVSGGINNLTQAQVTTILFDSFNSQEAALVAAGVRKTKASSTLSQDLEPEYVTVAADSRKAWVTLQENNAVAEINLENNTVTSIFPLGTKNMMAMGNGFDASDNNNEVLLANWPVKAFYIPDGMANYTLGGNTYLVTANEGDEKEYNGLNERTTVSAVTLDPAAFPHAAMLQENHNLGRLRISNLQGDTDNDGDFDELYVVGSRSFSIWNAETKALVYDSGDDFELITSTDAAIAPLFNSDNESNTKKSRSRAKGPEPEGVTVAEIAGNMYAFVALERVGGVMVYNVTDPADPKFVDYKNSRSLTTFAGDHGPEGIIFISATDSPTGKAYLAVANELSGTIAVFEVQSMVTSSPGLVASEKEFFVYPNPANGATVFLSKEADIEVLDALGRKVFTGTRVESLNVSNYTKGLYFIRTSEGAVKRLIVN
ncbi:T9SS type A sorting domain-containing protein [Pontibacter qinzhouensis]|uniref:T9SS type A sorting domain-containing protein n=1 Tax=Pontibacter qinzhouensis TaxID=2603253 RepID=A0A5C8KF57_9BACT|nr:choice-of-anchor I family protein [Pontibacter qinzhouensis]TXK52187.1 T9SS type A sorting domain-containing protein [Pontibacter qinzhouensis]